MAARCGTGTAPSRRLCRAPRTTSVESPSWWSGGMRAGVDLTGPGGVSAAERVQPPRADHEHLAFGARPAGLGEQAHHLKRQTRRIGRGDKEPAARNASC